MYKHDCLNELSLYLGYLFILLCQNFRSLNYFCLFVFIFLIFYLYKTHNFQLSPSTGLQLSIRAKIKI